MLPTDTITGYTNVLKIDLKCPENCSCFEIDQEINAILLIIGIVYRICQNRH
jgi:hypothetical protein